MFWLGHLVLSNSCCDGTWFDTPLHFPMVLIATLWASIFAVVLWSVWMALGILTMNFRGALARERQ